MRFSVSEVTMVVNAPPMITPIAMSITLPRSDSFNSFFYFFFFQSLSVFYKAIPDN